MQICNKKILICNKKTFRFHLIPECFSVHGCSWYVLLSIRCRYVSFFPFLAVWKSRKIISQFLNEHRQSHLYSVVAMTRWAPFFSLAQCTLIKKQTEERERGEEWMSVIYDIVCFILLVMWFWCQENTRL